MSRFDKAKIVAEIAKLGAEVWAIISGERRENRKQQNEERLAKLEADIAELKKKLDQ